MGMPIGNVKFDAPKTGIPIENVQFDAEPAVAPVAAPAPAPALPRPFSMEGATDSMEGTEEASQALTTNIVSLLPPVMIGTGLAGAAGAVAGAPWRKGAETAEKWMKAVPSIPLPETKEARMISSVPEAVMTTIRNYGTGKKLVFKSKDSWALKWTKESWGDQALAYSDSPTFAAGADTLGEFGTFMAVGKAAKGLEKRNIPVTKNALDAAIAQAILDRPKALAQGNRVEISGKEYDVTRVGKQGTDLVDTKTKEVITLGPGEKIKTAPPPLVPRVLPEGTEPPIPEGKVRLYRGEHSDLAKHDAGIWNDYGEKTDNGVGGWFSHVRNTAEYFKDTQGKNAHIVYLDLPAAEAAKYKTYAPGYEPNPAQGFPGEPAYFIPELRKRVAAEEYKAADFKEVESLPEYDGPIEDLGQARPTQSTFAESEVPDLVTVEQDLIAVKFSLEEYSKEADDLRATGAQPRNSPELKFLNDKITQSKEALGKLEDRKAELESLPLLPDDAITPAEPPIKKPKSKEQKTSSSTLTPEEAQALSGFSERLNNGKTLSPKETAEYNRLWEQATRPDTSILGNQSGQAQILNDIAAGVLKGGEELESIFAPASVSDISEKTAGSIREHNAAESLIRERISTRYDKSAESFEALSEADHLKFIDAAEHGQSTGYAAIDAVFADLRRMREKLWVRIQVAKGTNHFIDNFFPHFWEDHAAASRIFGTRPLAGGATFFKERTIPLVSDGYANGLKLVTTNPVRLEIMKMHEMLRWLKGQEIFEELKASGNADFVPYSKAPPDGYSKINDKIARVPFKGEWYAHADAAAVLNNYLSPGLGGKSVIFDGMRNVGNLMNNVQLGLSLFHMTFTALDATIGRFSLGIQEVLRGQGVDGTMHIASSFVPGLPVLQTIIKGNKAMKGLLEADPLFAHFATQLVEGGNRVKMGAFYRNSSIGKFWDAFGQKDYIRTGVHAIPAVIQYLARPMVEKWVPSMKLGMYMDMVASQNKFWDKHGIIADKEMRRKAYGKMTDAVDDRMGQMIYDNLFWHKTLKDVLMVSTRSLGWNLGTIRHLAGGAKDILDIQVDKTGVHISARTAYLVGLPAITALYSAMYQYMRTGKGPESLMDLRLPRTGKTTIDGREERISLPTYEKDVYAYKENFLKTVGHKVHPLISTMIQMFITGQNYYGVMNRNAEDPLMKQVADVSRAVAMNFIPFSAAGVLKRRESEASVGEQIEAFFGLLPAPKALTQTPAEKVADVISAKHRESGPTTREEFLHGQAKSDLLHGIANQTADFSTLIQEAFDQGIQSGELINIIRNSSKPHMTVALIKATPREAMSVWKVANEEEREGLYNVIIRKIVSNKALPPQDRILYMQQLQDGR